MKFFIAIALLAVAASARILPADFHLSPAEMAELEAIIEAIYSPSTDPTTAAMLEQMLLESLGLAPPKPPINVPSIIDEFEPIHIGPEIVEFPLPEGAVVATPIVPAEVASVASSSSPLVQIIVNVNQQPGTVSPAQVDTVIPTPVTIVEHAEEPEVIPTPVHIVEHAEEQEVIPTPVHIVDHAEEPEPVLVAPIIISPVVVEPEILN